MGKEQMLNLPLAERQDVIEDIMDLLATHGILEREDVGDYGAYRLKQSALTWRIGEELLTKMPLDLRLLMILTRKAMHTSGICTSKPCLTEYGQLTLVNIPRRSQWRSVRNVREISEAVNYHCCIVLQPWNLELISVI